MAFYDSITLEKGMYENKGKTLTDILEELDPSENYKGTEFEGLDAYQRQLKRYDIKVGGPYSDPVRKFFETSNSAALFPEYVSRAVIQGIEAANRLKDIIAAKTVIDSMDYRSITFIPNESQSALAPVAEGAFMPQTAVKTRDNLVHLHKRGRMLVASYEAIKFQRLDLFTVTLKQIGAYIAREQMKDAVDVIINGDGNNNAAAVVEPASKDALTYNDMLKLWAEISPYELNTILAPTEVIQTVLAMTEMKDANAGLDFQGTGKMITPMGASLIHIPSMSGKNMIGLDKNCALEMVQAGNVITDYDRLIDRQLERASISCITGFSKICEDASKVLSC